MAIRCQRRAGRQTARLSSRPNRVLVQGPQTPNGLVSQESEPPQILLASLHVSVSILRLLPLRLPPILRLFLVPSLILVLLLLSPQSFRHTCGRTIAPPCLPRDIPSLYSEIPMVLPLRSSSTRSQPAMRPAAGIHPSISPPE